MQKRFRLTSLIIVCLLAFGFWHIRGRRAASPGRPPEVAYRGGRLDTFDGFDVLRLSGSPREKGEAHGRLLRDRIHSWLRLVRPKEQGMAEFALETCGDRLLPFLAIHVREELEGIAAGAGASLHEIWYLNTRFELAPHLGGRLGFAGDAAVGAGPEVVRHFSLKDLSRRPRDLLVVVHEDRDPPLVLVALPGMAGGFLGLCGERARALRPMQLRTPPVLNGVVWTVLLRGLLVGPLEPEVVTLAASLPTVAGPDEIGTLNIAPSGSTWYPAPGGFSAATEDPVTTERTGRPAPLHAERARRILGAAAPPRRLAVRLKGSSRGVRVIVEDGGSRHERVVRYFE